jgi:hypothetical protein
MRTAVTRVSHSFGIRFGEICCDFTCYDKDIFDMLVGSLHLFRSNEPADITIVLDLVDRLDHSRMEADLSRKKIELGMGRAYYLELDAAGHKVVATTERSIFSKASGLRSLNQLLIMVYYAASRMNHPGRPPWMLVHSCGILRKGQVLLFTGPCETGKTTVGRFCSPDFGATLNDEMMLLSWPDQSDGGLLARVAPVFGELPFGPNEPAPLSRVFLLKQSQRIALRRVDRMEAYLRFLRQIMSPVGFQETDTRAVISLMDEFASAVAAAVPFFELEFTLDGNLLWEVEARLKEFTVTGV